MKLGINFITAGFLLLLLNSCESTATGNEPGGIRQKTFAPSDGDRLFILGQASEDYMEDYLREVKSTPLPAGFAFYTSLSSPQPLNDLVRYSQFLNKYPNTTLQLAIWTGLKDFGSPGYYLDEIVNGEHDENIIDLANACKGIRRPIFLRFGYEFDGAHNAYPPEKYIEAYKYFVDMMREQGVNNVAYVWHSWGVNAYYDTQNYPEQYPAIQEDINQELWYPGDEYVDWVAVSIFGTGWGNLNENSVIQYLLSFAEKKKKPVMIAESAAIKTSNHRDPNWVIPNSLWFQNVFSLMDNNKSIKAFTYINVDWEEGNSSNTWGDTQIQKSSTDVRNYWLSKIQPFLHGDENLFEEIGF